MLLANPRSNIACLLLTLPLCLKQKLSATGMGDVSHRSIHLCTSRVGIVTYATLDLLLKHNLVLDNYNHKIN
jgi:hypothetical protein